MTVRFSGRHGKGEVRKDLRVIFFMHEECSAGLKEEVSVSTDKCTHSYKFPEYGGGSTLQSSRLG